MVFFTFFFLTVSLFYIPFKCWIYGFIDSLWTNVMGTGLIFQSQTTCELFRIGGCDFGLQLDRLILHVFAYEHPDISPLYSQPLASLREEQTPSQPLLDKRRIPVWRHTRSPPTRRQGTHTWLAFVFQPWFFAIRLRIPWRPLSYLFSLKVLV